MPIHEKKSRNKDSISRYGEKNQIEKVKKWFFSEKKGKGKGKGYFSQQAL